jgi:BirA family biotin operon repressor/biotin-[acetyl-CoA-carboxylase] ligase
VSPKGGLYFSVVLRPELNAREAAKLVFVAGLAVAKVLNEAHGLKVETKWPNDVLVGGRKLCGILSEGQVSGVRTDWVVIGVGVNANVDVEKDFPEDLRKTATSLEAELGKAVRLEHVFSELVKQMEKEYDLFLQMGFARVLEEWKRYAVFLVKGVEVASGSERLQGLAVDIDDEGALVLKLEDGVLKRVFAGDVALRTRSATL